MQQEWRWRRHVLLPPFQPRQLVSNLQPYVLKRTQTLLETFRTHADQGTAIELDEVFQDLTMDVINYYLYGKSDLNYDLVGGRTNLKVMGNAKNVNEKFKLQLFCNKVYSFVSSTNITNLVSVFNPLKHGCRLDSTRQTGDNVPTSPPETS